MNKKISGYIYLVLLAISIVTPLLMIATIPIVQAARGNSQLAAVQCDLAAGTCADIKIATHTISIKAGSDKVEALDDDTAYKGWYFGIILNDVAFDGSIFYLYISKNGFSYITAPPDDIQYAGPFYVSALITPGLKKVEVTSDMYVGGKATFYVGTITIKGVSYRLIIGPVPFWLGELAHYRYIKIFDGLMTQVAVSLQRISILPSFLIEPKEGPGNVTISFAGAGIQPFLCINLTYNPTWSNVSPVTYVDKGLHVPDPTKCPVNTQIMANSTGLLYVKFNVTDLRLNWTGTGSIPFSDVYIYVWNVTAGDPTKSIRLDYVTFRQYARSIVELRSINRNYISQRYINLYTGAGNNTLIVKAYGNHTSESIILAGAWWNPGSTISIDVLVFGHETVTFTTPLDAKGFFNAIITLPVISFPAGLNATTTYTVRITETVDTAVMTYIFNITVVRPSISVTPKEGYHGDTITIELREFPFNRTAGLWWNSTCPELGKLFPQNITITPGESWWFNVKNITITDMEGGSASTTITVPKDVGGIHEIRGCVPWNCVSPIVDTTLLPPALRAFFKVLPRVEIKHSITGTNVFDNDGLPVYVVLSGLMYGKGYYIIVDNQFSLYGACDRCGYLNVTLVAAGFRPGLHVVSLYDASAYVGEVKPEYYALFTTTCRGDLICTRLDTLNATLTSINDSIATISTTLGTILAKIDTLSPVISRIDGNVATLITEIGVVKANLTTIRSLVESGNAMLVSINGSVVTIKTDVGTIKADVTAIKPTITSINNDVATIKTDVGTIKASVSDLKPVVTDIKNGVATVQTALGELRGIVEKVDGNVATIRTDVGTIKADISDVKGRASAIQSDVGDIKKDVAAAKTDAAKAAENTGVVPGLATAVWIAVVFSIISALLAAYAVMTIRKKIAA